MDKLFFVYILANCPRGVLYVGVTGDLVGRITVHRAKLAPGFTKTYGVTILVYYEEYDSISRRAHASGRSNAGAANGKMALVEKANPNWRDLADDIAL